ncbi:unnamed protein product [Acanthoscelides obtectus]|nr:unnamed protein product [Acanthoscelides obtectus]CAK1676470.1 hypothetical protein AOBTE_LOCUS30777 [Acanthoscelides obtectus]
MGSSCIEDVQCYTKTAHTVCRDNKCDCHEHMHHHNGTCYNNVALSQACTTELECSLTHAAFCLRGKCSCLDSHAPNRNATKCLPVALGHGASCEDDVQCTVTLGGASECHQGTCTCKEMYQLKASIGKCVRDMLLGDTCAEVSDCHEPFEGNTTRLECILGVCKCQPSYVEVDGFCINSSGKEASSIILCVVLSVLFIFL